ETDVNLHRPALESLRTLIRTSTSSMTSVPKPLKFLRPHYATVTEIYESWPESDNKDNELPSDDLMALALEIVPFFLKHNAEADAVDLLLELEAIEKLPDFVDKDIYARVCLYMVSCVNLLVPPDDVAFLRTAHAIYRKENKYTEAVSLAIRLGDYDLIREDFNAAGELD
ncbi:978_t:CDS:2, partial [Racocetra fulgida]